MRQSTPATKPCLHSHAPQGGNMFSGWLGRTALSLAGWSFEGTMAQHKKMVFAVAPHTSNWDFFLGVAVLFALRIRIHFLGKHTIFIPIFKPFLERIGGIPVNRKAKVGVVQQVVDKFDSNEKMILAVAPEGTRSLIYPWKTGFITIAHKANAHVVLIAFDFSDKKIKFGPTFQSQGDYKQDMDRVYAYYATIKAKYPQYTSVGVDVTLDSDTQNNQST